MNNTTISSKQPSYISVDELWHIADFNLGLLWRYRFWKSGHTRLLLAYLDDQAKRQLSQDLTDEDHLVRAADWLCRAQDASPDGGVVGRYRLDRGWTSSYPETTGYIIPTFIHLAKSLGRDYLSRAERCVDFLLSVQLDSGAFPAGEIADNRTAPSTFNSAQIIHGLVSWHQQTGDDKCLKAALRAGEWLLANQDEDGAWRNYFYGAKPATYSAYLSCWLAELGDHCADDRLLDGADRHLDWIMSQRDHDTGWFDRCGFTDEAHKLRIADTHTIGYTLDGLLRLAKILNRSDALEAVLRAAEEINSVLKKLKWLPGVLNWEWKARANSACLTGNAQLALVSMELHELTGEQHWKHSAFGLLDLVKKGQVLNSPNSALRGAVPGADPIWGWYNDGAVLNWSTKFFIDALLKKKSLSE